MYIKLVKRLKLKKKFYRTNVDIKLYFKTCEIYIVDINMNANEVTVFAPPLDIKTDSVRQLFKTYCTTNTEN